MNKFLSILFVFILGVNSSLAEVVRDEFVDSWFSDKEVSVIEPKLDYNYEGIKRVKIILSPLEKVSTPRDVYEGQVINLQVKRNARVGRDLLKRGTKAQAVVELYTTNGMTGIPASIVLGRVKINGLDDSHFRYYCVKKGQDRTLWILPLKWMLTFVPLVGSFTNFIKGGQAVVSPADDFVIYYYL